MRKSKLSAILLSFVIVLMVIYVPYQAPVFAEGIDGENVIAMPFENYEVKRSGAFGNKVYPVDGCNLSAESLNRFLEWNIDKTQLPAVSSCNLQFLNINQSTQDTEGYLFYLSVPAGTTTTFYITLNYPEDSSRWNLDHAPALSPVAGKRCRALADGETEWKNKKLQLSYDNGSRYRAGLYFEEGFTGFVKVPYDSLGSDVGFIFNQNSDTINSIVFLFDRFGGKYGEVIVGLNSLVVNYEADGKVVFSGEDSKYYNNIACCVQHNDITCGAEIGIESTSTVINKELGIKGVTVNNYTGYECPDDIVVGSQYYSNTNFHYDNALLSGTDGILMYIKLPGPNQVVIEGVLSIPDETGRWFYEYSPELQLYDGRKCYVMPIGASEWRETTVTNAQANGFRGAIEFDSAFEGFIKIPYSAMENDSGFVFSSEKDRLNHLRIRFKRIGGSYGSISFSELYLLEKNTASADVELIGSGEIAVQNSVGGVVSIDKASAHFGEKVTVSISPNQGYTLKADGLYVTYNNAFGTSKLIVSEYDTASNTFYFIMPKAENVILNAEFITLNDHNFALMDAKIYENNALEFTLREFKNSYNSTSRGILITLEESLGNNTLSKDLKGVDVIDVALSSDDRTFALSADGNYADYKVLLSDIKIENRAKNYIVRGYRIVNGAYYYTEAITVNYNQLLGGSDDFENFPEIYTNGSSDSYYDLSCSDVNNPSNILSPYKGIKAVTVSSICDKTVSEVKASNYWFKTNFAETAISDYYCLGFYMKVPAVKDNFVYVDFLGSKGENFKITSGKKYLLINYKTGEREYRTTLESVDKYSGLLTLPAGFEGLVCLPISALNPRSSITNDIKLINVIYRFGFIGKDENSVTVGPIVGLKQSRRIVDTAELCDDVEITDSSFMINSSLTEMMDNTAVLYWDKLEGAENYLLKAYKKVIGGYSCVSENTLFSNSGALDELQNGEEYILTLCARNRRDEILAQYRSIKLVFESPEDICDAKSEDIIYDEVDYSNGNVINSPFVNRSYTTLNAYNSSLLNSNPNRGLRGCVDFFHFNLTDAQIKTKLDSYSAELKNNGVNTSIYVCYLYPGDYIDGDLGEEFFTTTQKIFDYFRENKIQILLRFAYYDINNFNQRTPTTEEILRHINQLSQNGIIERNKDILHSFQVGFIGKYGEWHSDTPVETAADRSTVLNAFVEKLLPDGIYAQLRMPDYKDFLSADNAIKYGNRFGFNIDSFFGIGDGSEVGSGEYSYGYPQWNRHITECFYAPNDAEAYYWMQFDDLETYPEGYGSIIAAAQLRLSTLSAINGYLDQNINASGCFNEWKKLPVTKDWLSYNNLPVTESWFKDNSNNKIRRNVFQYIEDYLGYRISAKQLVVIKSQKGMNVSLDLVNYGFAAAFNISSKLVILDSNNNVVSYEVVGAPETWYGTTPGTVPDGNLLTHKIGADFELPIQSGNYKIALQLVSKSEECARLDNNIPYQNGYNILHTFRV